MREDVAGIEAGMIAHLFSNMATARLHLEKTAYSIVEAAAKPSARLDRPPDERGWNDPR